MNFYLAGNYDPELTQIVAKLLAKRDHKLTSGLDNPKIRELTTDAVIIDSRHPRANTLVGVFHQAGFPVIVVTECGPTLGQEDKSARRWHQLGATFCLRRVHNEEAQDELVDLLIEHFRVEAPVFAGMAAFD